MAVEERDQLAEKEHSIVRLPRPAVERGGCEGEIEVFAQQDELFRQPGTVSG